MKQLSKNLELFFSLRACKTNNNRIGFYVFFEDILYSIFYICTLLVFCDRMIFQGFLGFPKFFDSTLLGFSQSQGFGSFLVFSTFSLALFWSVLVSCGRNCVLTKGLLKLFKFLKVISSKTIWAFFFPSCFDRKRKSTALRVQYLLPTLEV